MSDGKCMTSIILVTYNNLDCTKQCVESIRRHTEQGSYELIIVDNGLIDDDTVRWAKKQDGILVIDNGFNAGFTKDCNQGLNAASGELLMLLHTSMVPAAGWLDGLKRCLQSDKRMGAVSPVTNLASYGTAIPVPYKTIEEMELFASALHAIPDKSKWEERVRLSGYCLLMKREAWEQAGPLDESFDMSDLVAGDYSLRLRLAGYKLMLCGDTFMHCDSDITSNDSDPEAFWEHYSRNSEIFVGKWGIHLSKIIQTRADLCTLIQRESYEYRRKACSIMEIGCGCGATSLYLRKQFPDARWYGVECHELAARTAETLGITVFRTSVPEEWTLPETGLDGIIIGDAHDYGTPETMKRLVRQLKPGGWLGCCFANRFYFDNIRKYLDPLNAEAQRQASRQYTVEQVHKLYLEAGFTYVKVALTENKPQGELAYIDQLEQVTQGAITRELISEYLLVYGRMATKECGMEESEEL